MSTPAPVHIYQTYIRASAEQVWQAITDPEFTKRYWHRTAFESAFEPGSPYRMVLPDGSDAVVGTIEEVEPPRRLVMTWRILYDAAAVDRRRAASSGCSRRTVTASRRQQRSIATSASARLPRPASAMAGTGCCSR